jgi:nucleoside-diphosphate-sugar epimerase
MNRRVSQIFIENAFKKQKIYIQGKNEKLDFTYIKDLASGSILAARNKKGKNQIFNITCGKGQTLFSYVSYLRSEFPKLKYVIKKRDKTKPSRGTLSIKKAKKLLGYKPKYVLKDGIKEYVKFLKKNFKY